MALPILNTPTYELTIPSTSKELIYRPFLVKEEKILLMAQESKDQGEVLRALKNIIQACTFDKINPDDLTSYDLEYIFLKLRSKSVGEIISLEVKCKHCDTVNPLDVNIEEIQIKYPEKEVEPTIQLSDEVGIVARHIPVKDLSLLKDQNDITSVIGLCIDSIFDGSKIYKRSDISEKELTDFVESFSREHVAKIEEFISNQPKLEHTIKYKCHQCKKENVITLNGLQDFFN